MIYNNMDKYFLNSFEIEMIEAIRENLTATYDELIDAKKKISMMRLVMHAPCHNDFISDSIALNFIAYYNTMKIRIDNDTGLIKPKKEYIKMCWYVTYGDYATDYMRDPHKSLVSHNEILWIFSRKYDEAKINNELF
jgi:hypothetical protein